jgi:type II secretion system protein G
LMKKGMALLEILVGLVIISFLVLLSLRLVGFITHKAKVVSAKAQIAQLAFLLETVKDDTGYYPAFLQDITLKIPPHLHEKGWDGFYTGTVPLDPWGTPYFYEIPPTTLFSSPELPREYGKPVTYYYTIETNPGSAVLRVENYGVTACNLYLNGVEVVRENEFKKNPKPQIIEKNITLLEANEISARVRSKPSEFLIFNISASNVPTDKYFLLGSYGKDKTGGGERFEQDIIWRSDSYPNFQ